MTKKMLLWYKGMQFLSENLLQCWWLKILIYCNVWPEASILNRLLHMGNKKEKTFFLFFFFFKGHETNPVVALSDMKSWIMFTFLTSQAYTTVVSFVKYHPEIIGLFQMFKIYNRKKQIISDLKALICGYVANLV